MDAPADTAPCHVCGRVLPLAALRPHALVRPMLSREIEAMRPGWGEGGFVCPACLALARARAVERLIEAERGALDRLDRDVVESFATGALVARPPEAEAPPPSRGDRLADRVAALGGSWGFIAGFGLALALWMGVNVLGLVRPFDPYPFILLNLVLSTLAALQAPVIMMSQRRQEAKDRDRAESDYRVNLKAELEIRQLHDKIDSHLHRQWALLGELQRMQAELLEEAAEARRREEAP